MKKLYSQLTKKRKEIEKETPIYIYQKDFSEGTYIIDKSGYYILKEDIVFSPSSDNDYLPKHGDPRYTTPGYSLGFFTAISIFAKDVYLNLDGHNISASKEFTLQQRFFSLIELANSPFLFGEGPGTFSTANSFKSANTVIIRNGVFGLSSHHSIHGNLASNVLLENLKMRDFEFVGIALNGGNSIVLHDIEIGPVRTDIPVLATYSGARFAKLFANMLLMRYSLSESQKEKLSSTLAILQSEMNITFSEIMNNQRVSSDLFRNDTKLPDGIVYAVLIKDQGFAVNDFVNSTQLKSEKKSKTNNVFLHSVRCKDLKCRIDEVIALSGPKGVGAQVSADGAVFQIDKVKENGKYKGTALSDLQLLLSEIALSLKIQLGKNSITQDTINWARNQTDISDLMKKGYKYKCGSDSMFHLVKLSQNFRFDALNNLVLKKCKIESIESVGFIGNDKAAGAYLKSHDQAKRNGYFGADSTAINISYCSAVKIIKCEIDKVISQNGEAIGINIIFNSDVSIEKTKIHDIRAGINCKVIDYFGKERNGKTLSTPNKPPRAIGIRIEKDCLVDLDDVSITELKSCKKPIKVLRE